MVLQRQFSEFKQCSDIETQDKIRDAVEGGDWDSGVWEGGCGRSYEELGFLLAASEDVLKIGGQRCEEKKVETLSQ